MAWTRARQCDENLSDFFAENGGALMIEQNKNYRGLADYKDLLSVEDLTEIFETTKATIYKEIKRGKFDAPIKIGRKYKIPKVLVYEKFFKSV
jgi:predicted DNA-binding protein YlxM (UPF0122 family)